MPNKFLTSREANQTKWSERIFNWEESGLSQTQFCINHGINLRTFQYWKRKLDIPEDLSSKRSGDRSVKIVQVQHEQLLSGQFHATGQCRSMIVHFREASIELEDNFCGDALSRLFRVLKSV